MVRLKLGDALAASGRRGESRATLEELRDRADAAGAQDLAAAARARLALLGLR